MDHDRLATINRRHARLCKLERNPKGEQSYTKLANYHDRLANEQARKEDVEQFAERRYIGN